jgi:hypothetical protein
VFQLHGLICIDLDKLALVASTVSSKMVEAMAQKEGFTFVDCLTGKFFLPKDVYSHTGLTGFKFIGNTALDLVRKGLNVPFGYEEAIGFMFGDEIRDKDGVAATVSTYNSNLFIMLIDMAGSLCRAGCCVIPTRQDCKESLGRSLCQVRLLSGMLYMMRPDHTLIILDK